MENKLIKSILAIVLGCKFYCNSREPNRDRFETETEIRTELELKYIVLKL